MNEFQEPSWYTPQMAQVAEALLSVIRRRLPMGLKESGLENYYAVRLDGRHALRHYSRAIAHAIVEDHPNVELIVDIGTGLGELPFLLAAEGFRTMAVERNKGRFAALLDLYDVLSAIYPQFGSLALTKNGDFPCEIEGYTPSHSLLISTGLIATTTAEQEQRILAGMFEYKSVIVDVAQLVRHRPDPQDWPEVEKLFIDAGYRTRRVIYEYLNPSKPFKAIWYER